LLSEQRSTPGALHKPSTFFDAAPTTAVSDSMSRSIRSAIDRYPV
jgi:hypothetical protein